jgi:formylglycine-generating enzyme required for sulfatase activity
MTSSALDSFDISGVGRCLLLSAGTTQIGNERPVVDWDGAAYPEHAANGPQRDVEVPHPFGVLDAPVTVAAMSALCPEVFAANRPVFCLGPGGSIEERWVARPFREVNRRDNDPVVGVTWDEAETFCRALKHRLGRGVRLPTEVEWEFAARAGSRSLYFWGDDVRAGDEFAWTDRNSGMRVQPVRTRRPNAWGLFDMAGNVWEWCADAFRTGSDVAGGGAAQRSIRGASSCHHATATRSAHRFGRPASERNAFLGFRCVIEPVGHPVIGRGDAR